MSTLTMTSSPQTGQTEFVGRHHRGLRRWLLALGVEPGVAEDHCQEALLAALHHGVEDWPRPRAWAWLRTAARNLHRMELRQQRRRPTHRLDEVEQAWLAVRGDEDGGDAALAALRRCLERAHPRDRELVHRRYGDEQSRDEMAGALGLGAAGIKQALRRARTRLRTCIEHRLEEDR